MRGQAPQIFFPRTATVYRCFVASTCVRYVDCFVAVDTVKRICEDTLNNGGYTFVCPACEHELTIPVVRHILKEVMTGEELNEVQYRATENFVKRPDTGIRQCQVCGVNWKRDFTKRWPGHRNRLVCNTCSRNQGREVQYCWGCRREWRGNAYTCGHSDCTWEKEQIQVLENCGTKTIGSVTGCPIIRACPGCATLIHHVDRCKRMTCKCGCKFCFVCLKKKRSFRLWECTPYDFSCPIAARQTALPNPDLPVQRRRSLVTEVFRNYFSWFTRWFR